MIQSKKKQIVLEDEIPKSEGTHSATRKEQKANRNCTVANEPSEFKAKGCEVTDVYRSKSKV